MAKQIFILYSCDEWDSNSKAILCTLSEMKLKKAIRTCIEKDEMNYSDGSKETPTTKEQVKMFERDWKTETRRTICDRLKYGHYTYVYDGEFI